MFEIKAVAWGLEKLMSRVSGGSGAHNLLKNEAGREGGDGPMVRSAHRIGKSQHTGSIDEVRNERREKREESMATWAHQFEFHHGEPQVRLVSLLDLSCQSESPMAFRHDGCLASWIPFLSHRGPRYIANWVP